MLYAVEHIGTVGVGVTSPQLFRANDEQLYIVKLQRNRLGPKVLANEWLAAQLGGKLKLCFPPSAIIELSAQVILSSPCLARKGIIPGKQFACRYLPHSYYLNRWKISKAVNKQQMAGVMLFDHLLHNVDRTWNRKNLLIRKEEQGPTLYAIDHSHLFIRGRWTVESLAKLADRIHINCRRSYGILLKYFLKPVDFEPYAAAIAMLDDAAIGEIVGEIPHEWLPLREEREQLCSFLIRRRDLAPEICRQLCALIPDENRCADSNKSE